MTVQALACNNIRSLFENAPWSANVETLEFTHKCAVCFQDYWINEDSKDDLAHLETFQGRAQSKKTGGNISIHINIQWSDKSSIVFTLSSSGVECVAVRCHPKHS